MRRIVVGRWWMVRLLAGLTIMAALALAVPLGAAAATQPDTATADTPATAPAEPTQAAPEPSPAQDTPAGSEPDPASAAADPAPALPTDPAAAAAQQAREQAAAQQKALDEAAERQAKAQALAEKRAAQAARAAQRAQASWAGHGRPHKLIIIKQRSIDLVTNGRLTRQAPRSGGALTLSTLGRFVLGEWLRIAEGTAELTAATVLTPGQSLTLGGDVRTVRLAGGPTPSDAASIYTGRGRLALRGVTVGSFDPGTGAALPAGPGRPFLAVARGGRFEATDSAINDLGTVPTDPAPGPASDWARPAPDR
jgi:hypothetical protein